MFCDVLQNAMKMRGMTGRDLAAATGISQSLVSWYLSGKGEPRDEKKERIALALGLDADYFFNWFKMNRRVSNLPVETAAKLMNKSTAFIKRGLRDGVFPFGYAVRMLNGKWSYYISPMMFSQSVGCDLPDSILVNENDFSSTQDNTASMGE